MSRTVSFFILKFTSLNIYYQNVRGLRTKTNDFSRNLSCYNYDIVILTETWLLSSITSSELFDDRYTVYRRDRTTTVLNTKSIGGGVLIAVSNKFTSKRYINWESCCEDLWVVVELKTSGTVLNLALCALYLPPPVNKAKLEHYIISCNKILESTLFDNLAIVGDFNVSGVNCNIKSLKTPKNPSKIQILAQFCNENNLKQCNAILNNSNKT